MKSAGKISCVFTIAKHFEIVFMDKSRQAVARSVACEKPLCIE